MEYIRNRWSITFAILFFGLMGAGFAIKSNVPVGVQPDGRILVPNGQALTPAGEHLEINDRPLLPPQLLT